MPLALVPNWANCMWFHLFLVQIQSKSGHSWQGLLCLNAKSWLRCSHISQPGLTQLYSVHHEFTKIWCFNINISQSSDLWDIYLVNPSSILALKPHSNCLRLVLHASMLEILRHIKIFICSFYWRIHTSYWEHQGLVVANMTTDMMEEAMRHFPK